MNEINEAEREKIREQAKEILNKFGKTLEKVKFSEKKKKEDAEVPASAPEAVVVKPATPPRIKIPKLAKKEKSRLPRKQKKAQQKAAPSCRSVSSTGRTRSTITSC